MVWQLLLLALAAPLAASVDFSDCAEPLLPAFPRPPYPRNDPWSYGFDKSDVKLGRIPVPDRCPRLLQPHNIHFMVINLDKCVLWVCSAGRVNPGWVRWMVAGR
jgi:hypothetical protein